MLTMLILGEAVGYQTSWTPEKLLNCFEIKQKMSFYDQMTSMNIKTDKYDIF